MKLAALTSALLVVLGSAAATAGAAPSKHETALGFCGVARGVARDIMKSTTFSKGATPANLRITYTKIAAAEPSLLATAPGSMKAHLRPVFGFVNLVITDFKKVNWNPAGMGPYYAGLSTRARGVEGHLNALKVYFNTTCKLDV
jgi:hypothetical protein